MSVADSTQQPKRNTSGRSVKSWVNITPAQKSALDALARDNHMSTSEYQRVVLSFAIAHGWGFPIAGTKSNRGPIDEQSLKIGMGPIPT